MKKQNVVIAVLALGASILLVMGLFSFFKKPAVVPDTAFKPYKEEAINFVYNLLFCDNIGLLKEQVKPPYTYPFDILLSAESSVADLQSVIDSVQDPRIQVFAYNQQREKGHHPAKKEILAVIVEVGLEDGLDVLASFKDGTARYINQSGKLLVWETTTDTTANGITEQLFANSQTIVSKIGPWDKPRRPQPSKGIARITFLVSDGFYFGEGKIEVLFNDAMAAPALTNATQLMQYLTQKQLDSQK